MYNIISFFSYIIIYMTFHERLIEYLELMILIPGYD